ncbi:MAG: hypothetical protein OEX03_00350 [Gammaproteobacteria bacterium]|nr:hypothetical protein [Gammaproteobacteria bacterium]
MENLNSDAKKVPLSLNTPIKTIMGKYKVFANFRNQSYENIDKIIEIKLFDFIKQETIDLQTPHGEIYVQDLSPQTYTYINSIQVDTHTTRSTPGRYKVISYRNIDSIHAYYEEYSIPVNKGKVTRISSPTKRIVKPGILIKPEVTGRGDYSITSKLYGKVLITVNHDDTMVRLLPGHYIVDKINHDNTTTSIPVLLATPGNIIMLER